MDKKDLLTVILGLMFLGAVGYGGYNFVEYQNRSSERQKMENIADYILHVGHDHVRLTFDRYNTPYLLEYKVYPDYAEATVISFGPDCIPDSGDEVVVKKKGPKHGLDIPEEVEEIVGGLLEKIKERNN